MNKKIKLLAVVAAFLLAISFWWFSRPVPISVALARAESGLVEATVSNTRAGTIKACRRAKIAPSNGGMISTLKVSESDRVKKGDILFELWNKDLGAQEKLSLKSLDSAKQHSRETCLQATLAQSDLERTRKLKEYASREKLERAETEARAKAAACEASISDIEQARAKITVASAQVEKTVIRAPFDGIVAKVTGELGEFTTPSPPGIPTPPAIDLIDDSCLYVTAPIDEVDAPNIKIGMPAKITLDAFAGKHFPGKIKKIAPYVLEIEKQARTVDVDVDFADPGNAKVMLVGYSADVEVVLQSKKTLRIPTRALLEGNRVLVYIPERGILEERKIETGISNWEYTEVLSGLKENDQVALSLEKEGIKPGARVAPEKK